MYCTRLMFHLTQSFGGEIHTLKIITTTTQKHTGGNLSRRTIEKCSVLGVIVVGPNYGLSHVTATVL